MRLTFQKQILSQNLYIVLKEMVWILSANVNMVKAEVLAVPLLS